MISEYKEICIITPPGIVVILYFMSKKIGNFSELVTYDVFSRGHVLSYLILNISSLDSPILEIKNQNILDINLSKNVSYSYIVEVFHLWMIHLSSWTPKLPIFTYTNNTIISQCAFDMFCIITDMHWNGFCSLLQTF